MSKIVSLCLSILVSTGLMAQVQWGLFAGPQISSSKYTIDSHRQPNTAKYGFQAGVSLKVPFDNHLYFTPAAFYSLKGYHVKFNQVAFPPDVIAVNNRTDIHTFELAFLLQYDLGSRPGHFFIKAGPSLDFQLFGREKFDLRDSVQVSRNMKFDFSNYGHYGANLLLQLGYEIGNGLFLFAQYTHGLGSINNADGGPRIHHRVFGLSVGKYLGRRKIVVDTRNRE